MNLFGYRKWFNSKDTELFETINFIKVELKELKFYMEAQLTQKILIILKI